MLTTRSTGPFGPCSHLLLPPSPYVRLDVSIFGDSSSVFRPEWVFTRQLREFQDDDAQSNHYNAAASCAGDLTFTSTSAAKPGPLALIAPSSADLVMLDVRPEDAKQLRVTRLSQ